MAGACSYRAALDRQATENHRRVAQRKEQKSLEDYDKPESAETKPVTKPGKSKRGKPHKKGSRAKV